MYHRLAFEAGGFIRSGLVVFVLWTRAKGGPRLAKSLGRNPAPDFEAKPRKFGHALTGGRANSTIELSSRRVDQLAGTLRGCSAMC